MHDMCQVKQEIYQSIFQKSHARFHQVNDQGMLHLCCLHVTPTMDYCSIKNIVAIYLPKNFVLSPYEICSLKVKIKTYVPPGERKLQYHKFQERFIGNEDLFNDV